PFYVIRAFKKKVLEEMGKTGSLRVFVLRTYVIEYRSNYNRCGIVPVHDDVKSIVQGEFFEFNLVLRDYRRAKNNCQYDHQVDFSHIDLVKIPRNSIHKMKWL